MIFVILTAVALVAIIAVLHFENHKLKSFFLTELHNLSSSVDHELQDQKTDIEKLAHGSHADALPNEITVLKQEKENEIKLRIEAEKQAAIALQRITEIEKRMNDWKILQDAMLKNAKEAMIEAGKEAFQNIKQTPVKPSNSLVASLLQAMNKTKFIEGKNYFLPSTFDANQAKSMFCEIALIDQNKLYILDFKGGSYFKEYNNLIAKDPKTAENLLKQRLDKYFDYLGNQKYYDSISALVLKTNPKLDNGYVIMVLPSKNDAEVIKKLNYSEKAANMAIDVAFLDEIKSLVL